MSTSASGNYYLAAYYSPGAEWILGKVVGGVYSTVAIAPSPIGNVGQLAEVWEWRDGTPTIPANPTLSASYGGATLMRNWGAIAGPPHPSKRTVISGGAGIEAPTDLANGQAGTTPWCQFGWDNVNNHLYWVVSDTYVGSQFTWFGYSELNYATGEVIDHGPFGHAATLFKGSLAGIFNLPASFVTAAGLGTKRMATCGSTYASVAASGDSSCGPQITAFEPPSDAGAAEGEANLPSVRMCGFAPWAQNAGPGFVRATHPASMPWYEGEAHHAALPVNGWPDNVWEQSFNDVTYGGVMIKGTTKSGFVSIQSINKGCVNYNNAHVTAEMRKIAMTIVSEADLINVINGVIAPSAITLDTQPFTFPVIDPADQQSTNPWHSIATITATAGETCEYSDAAGVHQGAIITTTAPHGLTIGSQSELGVQGSSNYQYNGIWGYLVESTTTIRIWNNSLASHMTYSGVTGTGGHTFTVGHGGDGSGPALRGLAFDEVTNQLYLGFLHKDGTPMIGVWSVNC